MTTRESLGKDRIRVPAIVGLRERRVELEAPVGPDPAAAERSAPQASSSHLGHGEVA